MDKANPNAYRRVVTGHRGGKAVVLSDVELSTYAFKNIPGFKQTYVWVAPALMKLILQESMPPCRNRLCLRLVARLSRS